VKLDGFRMAARIERGKAKLLTRTGLDGSAKYPSVLTALAAVRAGTAYLDGELCGVGNDGLPNFAETQAATEGARGVRLVFYAFDSYISTAATPILPLVERKALLERHRVTPVLESNGWLDEAICADYRPLMLAAAKRLDQYRLINERLGDLFAE
jgi:ATP-dependent DNA ligase